MIQFELIKDFLLHDGKNVFYIVAKDGPAYQMRPLIYDSKFKKDVETPHAMDRISFPDLLPTFFRKATLFSIAWNMGKPIHLDMATINKIKT